MIYISKPEVREAIRAQERRAMENDAKKPAPIAPVFSEMQEVASELYRRHKRDIKENS